MFYSNHIKNKREMRDQEVDLPNDSCQAA